MKKPPIIVSACLVGIKCRYDSQHCLDPEVEKLVANGEAIPLCPEQLAGLSTPRLPCERSGDNVFEQSGQDMSEVYLKGAREAVKLVELVQAEAAILKAKSPMCGVGEIYDGTFSGKLVAGDGVFTQLLRKLGLTKISSSKN